MNYYKTDVPCDSVKITWNNISVSNNYNTEVLVEGVDYTQINSRILQFDNFESAWNPITIYTLNPAKTKLSPAKLVDTDINTTVLDIPVWDPARGYHFHLSTKVIDLYNTQDPASYSVSKDLNKISDSFWNVNNKDVVWFDTSITSYIPYYDSRIFDTETRLSKWGKMSDWGDIKLYQWTESTVPPEEYDALSAVQSNNTSIDDSERITGTAKTVTYNRKRVFFDTFSASVGGLLSFADAHSLSNGDKVLLSSTDTLPAQLTPETEYTVISAGTFSLSLLDADFNAVVFTDTGSGTHTIATVDWETVYGREETSAVEIHPTIDIVTPGIIEYAQISPLPPFSDGDEISIYINGSFSETSTSSDTELNITISSYTESDIITIVRLPHIITDDDKSFDPAVSDDGTIHIQYTEEYEYSTTEKTLPNNNTETLYYFWVGKKTVHTKDRTLSLSEAESQMISIPIPFLIYQSFMKDETILSTESGTLTEIVPGRYTQIVVRGLEDLINDDDRYVLRFTQDFTLRDDLNDGESLLDLKNVHQEWRMFRINQPYHIDRYLWNKVTEAIIGFKLDSSAQDGYDPTLPIPTYNKVLYDETYNTDTQYGLGAGQAFVDRKLALVSIISDLENPDNVFYPADISSFFTHNSFDTTVNIIKAMDTIYNTFGNEHVNRMFFSVLMDALTNKQRYDDLLKTSMVSLHGIRILETAGIFDD